LLRTIHKNMRQRRSRQKLGEKSAGRNKGKEITIVAATDAVVQPHAVVVQCFHTVVTPSTVVATRRSPDVTSLAILYRDIHR
jgi:hypothetical protein